MYSISEDGYIYAYVHKICIFKSFTPIFKMCEKFVIFITILWL